MEFSFFVYLYIFLFAVVVEFLLFKRLRLSAKYQTAKSKEIKRRKGLTHLGHAYLLIMVTLIASLSDLVGHQELAALSLAVFFSFSVAFISLFNRLFITVISSLAVIFLLYFNLTFLVKLELVLFFSPAFYLLFLLLIFILYLSMRRK